MADSLTTLPPADSAAESPRQSHSLSTPTQLRTAIAGVSGYAGGELARLLLLHPRLTETKPIFLGRMETTSDATSTKSDKSEKLLLTDLQPQLATGDGTAPEVVPFNWQRLVDEGIDLLFLATPHEQSREWVPEAIARGLRVIDLSGAWRLQDERNRAVYNLTDADPVAAQKLQTEAVYGNPELHRDQIRNARLVANPGCYSTSIILALAPLLRAGLADLDYGIVADAKSGVSGAGKAATAKTHFMYAADNLSAYSVFGHRHTGELLEQLHLDCDQIQFTPHLLPIPRGILSTIYVRLKSDCTRDQIAAVYADFYRSSPLVRLRPAGNLPQIQYVTRTNFCDLGFELAPHSPSGANGRRLVLVSCLDNLLKGAAGQAVQNMNVMYGWNEAEGLL
ncbi:MAG TPA: N-acetyl-gamma-glutamyl-phosphate reductase [Granulicella sp.]|nr:N-acetyl-gamma-glutamyl-phosphate reductase [Granulicella sp.]